MESSREIERQAVVIIHGMGEQRPMDTLRSFVDSLKRHLAKHDDSEKDTVVWSKPDGISEIYETRRLTLSSTRNRPVTDFYEFYWAHNMRDNKFKDILFWIYKLLFSQHKKVPPRLLPAWKSIWMLLIITFLGAAAAFFLIGIDILKVYWTYFAIIPFVFSLIFIYIESTILSTLGDAGRYFTPSPGNIGERNNIRQQGITFLKKVQGQNGDRKYDRVILVAHSLGAVITYDLIKLLWTDYNQTYNKDVKIEQDALKEIAKYSKRKEEINNIHVFQDAQFRCWWEQKHNGNEWLISDFITLGAPLCHADYLILNSLSFNDLKLQKEFPACPPLPDVLEKEIHFSRNYETVNGTRTIRLLDHAALFAVTRWTNIYFSSDFIGGPMHRLFGDGVKDVQLPRKSLSIYPGGHTNYWDDGNEEALKTLAHALHLRGDFELKTENVSKS